LRGIDAEQTIAEIEQQKRKKLRNLETWSDRMRRINIFRRDTKTGNDEWLPVVAPLAKLLSDGWEQINLRRAEY
jgi:hypothetical protein